jgi:hypothetical protein
MLEGFMVKDFFSVLGIDCPEIYRIKSIPPNFTTPSCNFFKINSPFTCPLTIRILFNKNNPTSPKPLHLALLSEKGCPLAPKRKTYSGSKFFEPVSSVKCTFERKFQS